MAEYETVAIVGVGLIGGSIGLALRERKLAREVVGVGRHEEKLASAQQAGVIDRGTTDLADGVAQAEVIVVATPVDTIVDLLIQAAAVCPPTALITDAGSTKEVIVSAVDVALAGRRTGPRFVGSHPLAGDHRTGHEHARADLFEGRAVVLTPTDATPRPAVVEANGFWQSLGANVIRMTPGEHDAALAATSHMPHLVASALAAATPKELLPLAASGWRDTTRVAGGDPELWRAIFATNRPHVVSALDRLIGELGALRQAVDQGDDVRLLEILERAKIIKWNRDALGD
jgi:prephenate dehydrogenase